METLSALELAVMQKLLAGDHPALAALRQQLALARVRSRKETGVGFYSEFEIPLEVGKAPVRADELQFGDVEGALEGLKHGAGFLLFVKGGRLHMLEGYSYDEPWPRSVGEFSLRYSNTSREDLLKTLA